METRRRDDMKPGYEPKTLEEHLFKVSEECAEVIQATSKIGRFGLLSTNPDLPAAERITNQEHLLLEMEDAEREFRRLREFLGVTPLPEPPSTRDLTMQHLLKAGRSLAIELAGHIGGEPSVRPNDPDMQGVLRWVSVFLTTKELQLLRSEGWNAFYWKYTDEQDE
jgi:hypothetical protein